MEKPPWGKWEGHGLLSCARLVGRRCGGGSAKCSTRVGASRARFRQATASLGCETTPPAARVPHAVQQQPPGPPALEDELEAGRPADVEGGRGPHGGLPGAARPHPAHALRALSPPDLVPATVTRPRPRSPSVPTTTATPRGSDSTTPRGARNARSDRPLCANPPRARRRIKRRGVAGCLCGHRTPKARPRSDAWPARQACRGCVYESPGETQQKPSQPHLRARGMRPTTTAMASPMEDGDRVVQPRSHCDGRRAGAPALDAATHARTQTPFTQLSPCG